MPNDCGCLCVGEQQVGTVVRVKGNNRTRQDLNGCSGRVLSAAALGGWHTCIVTDKLNRRSEVRVQRNALEVDYSAMHEQASPGHRSTAVKKLKLRGYGEVSYSQSTFSTASSGATCSDSSTGTELLPHKSESIPPMWFSQAEERPSHLGGVLGKLRYGTLRKYRRVFGLRIGKTHTKQQLAGLVCHHFANWIVPDEGAAVDGFLATLHAVSSSASAPLRTPIAKISQIVPLKRESVHEKLSDIEFCDNVPVK